MLGRIYGCRMLWPLLGLLLADCPAAGAQPGTGAPAPANYRQLVADSDVASIFREQDRPKKSKRGDQARSADPVINPMRLRPRIPAVLSVSSLRPAIAPELGDWFTCLKAVRGRETFYYGLSFVRSEIVEWRPAVAIDRCEQQAYGPLPPTTQKPKVDDDDDDVPDRGSPRRR